MTHVQCVPCRAHAESELSQSWESSPWVFSSVLPLEEEGLDQHPFPFFFL